VEEKLPLAGEFHTILFTDTKVFFLSMRLTDQKKTYCRSRCFYNDSSNELVMLDAGHYVWEDAHAEYSDHLQNWINAGYKSFEV